MYGVGQKIQVPYVWVMSNITWGDWLVFPFFSIIIIVGTTSALDGNAMEDISNLAFRIRDMDLRPETLGRQAVTAKLQSYFRQACPRFADLVFANGDPAGCRFSSTSWCSLAAWRARRGSKSSDSGYETVASNKQRAGKVSVIGRPARSGP